MFKFQGPFLLDSQDVAIIERRRLCSSESRIGFMKDAADVHTTAAPVFNVNEETAINITFHIQYSTGS